MLKYLTIDFRKYLNYVDTESQCPLYKIPNQLCSLYKNSLTVWAGSAVESTGILESVARASCDWFGMNELGLLLAEGADLRPKCRIISLVNHEYPRMGYREI